MQGMTKTSDEIYRVLWELSCVLISPQGMSKDRHRLCLPLGVPCRDMPMGFFCSTGVLRLLL